MFKIAMGYAVKMALILILLLTTGLLTVGFYLDNKIFSPPRKVLQNYHLEHLNQADQHGLRIRSYGCLQGQVPCLLVEPNPQTGAAKRGTLLRQQLAQQGVHLKRYGEVNATLLLLHGRNGRKEDLLPVAERFVAAGFRCLIPDLPAHGENPRTAMAFGSSHFEKDLPQKILADARQHFQLPNEPAILWGISMGGAFALSAASRQKHPWNALIVVSSFANLKQILDQNMPQRWRPFASGLYPLLNLAQTLRGQPTIQTMQPQQWAKQVTIPTLIVHGDQDSFVPQQQGRQLYNTLASTEKRWINVTGGGHNSVLSTTMPLYAEMSHWLIDRI